MARRQAPCRSQSGSASPVGTGPGSTVRTGGAGGGAADSIPGLDGGGRSGDGTGPADGDAEPAAGVEHEVHAYCPDMGGVYRRADLAITRSGAATCAELLAHRLPALLVPYPYAARRHQHANARAMSRYGAADWVDERDLESAWLADYIDGMRRAPERRHRMAADAARHAQPAADVALADVVEEAARASSAV